MTTRQARWWLLIGGVVVCGALLLAVDYLPGLPKPEIGENRVLAAMPAKPPATLAGLKAYREGMDAYVADNFPARIRLIAALNYVRYRLGYSGTPRVVVGRDGWLFYDDGGHLAQLRHAYPLSEADLSAWVATLAARTRYLEARRVDYLLITPPVKERVYPDKAPTWALAKGGVADADALSAAAQRVGLQNMLVLKDALVEQRKLQSDVFSPFDTHWTGNGAYAAYVAIMAKFSQMGHPMRPRPLSTFARVEKARLSQPQDVAVMLGIASFVNQKFPQYRDAATEAGLRVEYLTDRHDWTGDHVIDTGFVDGPVLQWAGDSFSNELLPFFYPHFSRLIVSHHQEGFFRSDLTEKYRPDIVVLEVIESGVRHSMSPALVPDAALAASLAQRRQGKLALANAAAPAPAVPAFTFDAPLPGQGGHYKYAYRCNLEALVVSAAPFTVSASGWAADVDRGQAADKVTLVLQSRAGSYRATTPTTDDRPDVAAHFGKPALRRSGFRFRLQAPPLPQGSIYEVFLLQRFGEQSLVCSTGRTIIGGSPVRTTP